MSTDRRTDRRRSAAEPKRTGGAGTTQRRRADEGKKTKNGGTERTSSGSRNRAGAENSRTGRNQTGRSRTGSSSGERRGTGRGMSRQQRQKQLLTRVLIGVAALIVVVLIMASVIRAGSRKAQSAETAQTTATAQTAAVQEPAGNEMSSGSADAEAAPSSGSVTTQGSGTEQEDTGARGTSVADQSLVEKLSVDAKNSLEVEKERLAREEEELQRLAAEEAKKAEVKDREELSELPIEELVEYLRNKEVPEELIEFMEEYPEAREFVTDYLYQPETPPSIDISGEVVQGQFPHFLQWDERWGYKDYGGSFFAVAGCGPTAMSVVYSGLTGKTDMDPYTMSQWAEDQGYYIVGEGTSWEMMWSGANLLGLYSWEVDNNEAAILTNLRSGCPIIAAMSPGGDFTSFGHFIVLVSADDEGNITIRDSNSIERTERTWTADELTWQIAGLWGYNYVE